jgi:hypothetical protein
VVQQHVDDEEEGGILVPINWIKECLKIQKKHYT